jgi:hypothetical protein
MGLLTLKSAKTNSQLRVSVSGSFDFHTEPHSDWDGPPQNFLDSLKSRTIWAARAPGYHLSLTTKLNGLDPPRETLEYLEELVRDAQVRLLFVISVVHCG